jgi:hypothetical protein
VGGGQGTITKIQSYLMNAVRVHNDEVIIKCTSRPGTSLTSHMSKLDPETKALQGYEFKVFAIPFLHPVSSYPAR